MKQPESATHIFVKPLSPTDEALCRLLVERYEGPNGEPLVPDETALLVAVRIPDIRMKRSVLVS